MGGISLDQIALDKITINQIPAHRKQIRKQRRQLSKRQLRQAEIPVVHKLLNTAEIKKAKKIGLYLSDFGEVPTQALIQKLILQNKKVYIPMIYNMNQRLFWTELTLNHLHSNRLARHRLSMQQIMATRAFDIDTLDVVIIPLVLFDRFGHRVGMGGGFYDRTLAKHPYRPIRLGLAHDFQEVDGILATQIWDQNLDLVCTPTRLIRF
uniref:5-formyltetrahydrofolate cyclo-ligase n=1 Tax=uncultured Acinetobacter sp. TaxID=165433 RepID=UPI00263401EE|nr:5-formyltetrahydrofolate cyclo-ligase [uncultured Acinetobacter sp.]